jgi:hypothetical protein
MSALVSFAARWMQLRSCYDCDMFLCRDQYESIQYDKHFRLKLVDIFTGKSHWNFHRLATNTKQQSWLPAYSITGSITRLLTSIPGIGIK